MGKKDQRTVAKIEKTNLEEHCLQEIANQIFRKSEGHEMKKVIASILEAKGFTTYINPEWPVRGAHILASRGPLGFGPHRICVRVESGVDPVGRIALDQLVGMMSTEKVEYGLLVSWSGFKRSVLDETANKFFNVRLWTYKDILQEFLKHYWDLPKEIRKTIPLKRIWIIGN